MRLAIEMKMHRVVEADPLLWPPMLLLRLLISSAVDVVPPLSIVALRPDLYVLPRILFLRVHFHPVPQLPVYLFVLLRQAYLSMHSPRNMIAPMYALSLPLSDSSGRPGRRVAGCTLVGAAICLRIERRHCPDIWHAPLPELVAGT